MLIVWTAADPDQLRRTVGRALKAMGALKPPHRVVPLGDGPYLAEAGEIVLACGSKPFEQLRQAGLAPKNRSLGSMRETPLTPKAGGGSYLLSYDPGIIGTEPDKQQLIEWDTRLAARLLATGSTAPEIGEYRWVGGFSELIAATSCKFAATGKPVELALDTETMGLHPWYPGKDIVSIGFTGEAGTADCLYLGPYDDPVTPLEQDLKEQIRWLLTAPEVRIRGANLKYDLVWIAEKWGLECTNFTFDTCLVGSLLDENRSNGLTLHSKLFTGMGGYDSAFNATFDKGQMEAIPPEALLPYQGADCDATLQVAQVLKDQLRADGKLARFYKTVLHPAARAFEKIERRGVLVDVAKYQELGEHLALEVARLEQEALELLPRRLVAKYRDKLADQLDGGKSPFTPKILQDYFFGARGLALTPKMLTEKSGMPSTARAHLRMFADNPEAQAMCQVLEAMHSASKTKSTFVDGFLKHLRPDGRLHPSYMLYHGGFNDDEDNESGTVTGRLAAKEPAIQTLPQKARWAKRLRECYVAPEGKVIVSADYEQGELKVVACVAQEKNMIAAYQKGMDLHAVTGASLGGVDYAEFVSWKDSAYEKYFKLYADLRQQAKAGNFGLLYGMGVEGFIDYAWANYGLRLSHSEAAAIHAAFFEMYPGLTDYHDRQRGLARQFQEVRSPLGRIRHLPLIKSWDQGLRARAERQAVNSPIQSCLSDMTLWAAALIEAELAPQVELVGMIHDSLLAYLPADNPEHWAGQMAKIMATLPLDEVGWHPELTFTAEAKVGPNLAQLKQLKLAA